MWGLSICECSMYTSSDKQHKLESIRVIIRLALSHLCIILNLFKLNAVQIAALVALKLSLDWTWLWKLWTNCSPAALAREDARKHLCACHEHLISSMYWSSLRDVESVNFCYIIAESLSSKPGFREWNTQIRQLHTLAYLHISDHHFAVIQLFPNFST